VRRDGIEKGIERGEANKEVIELAQNWCAHLRFEVFGGIGLVEEQTGLPIGSRRIVCPHASAAGMAAMDLSLVAIDFYDRNCKDCRRRLPVRLPNLIQLIGDRDRALERQREMADSAIRAENEALEQRCSARTMLIVARQDGLVSGIVDLLNRFDRSPTEENASILVETAFAAETYFDNEVQGCLFELADVGGEIRTCGALRALDRIATDKGRLCSAALRALARGEATSLAGALVAKHLDEPLDDLLDAALPALISLAGPLREEYGTYKDPNAEPAGLLAAFRLARSRVDSALRKCLLEETKWPRICACRAILILLQEDAHIGLRLFGDLIRALTLTDDHYGMNASAEHAIQVVMVRMFESGPHEIDALLERELESANEEVRNALFSVYSMVLDTFRRSENRHAIGDAPRVAFKRIIEALFHHPSGERLTEVIVFLRDHSEPYVDLIEEQFDTLLGAAALFANEIDDSRVSPLDPTQGQTPLALIEAMGRRQSLSFLLHAIAEAVGKAGRNRPQTFGKLLVAYYESIEDRHDWLKATLTRSLGVLGSCPEGCAVVLPAFYTAMTSGSVRVRAEAATSFAKIAPDNPEDLPPLAYETFLLLLADPYVAVHQSAVRALYEFDHPPRHTSQLQLALFGFIRYYGTSMKDARFFAECVRLFFRFFYKRNVPVQTKQTIVEFMLSMEPDAAADLLGSVGHRLKEAPNLGRAILSLIGNPELDIEHIDDLFNLLRSIGLPSSSLAGLIPQLLEVTRACQEREVDIADEVIEVLGAASFWKEAVQVASATRDRWNDTKWHRPRKLRARGRQIATSIEFAASIADTRAMLTEGDKWTGILKEIELDEKEQPGARSSVFGVQFPDQG
jgi:hypothetical protein